MKALGKSYDIEEELAEVQADCGLVLAEKQKEAVRMVFKSPVSIITGGPGKGKTTVLKIILQIFERLEKDQSVLLCAPTGRARKRLSESTGYPALTIHKALYLTGEEEEDQESGECLEEGFIIADEFTMSDMKLSSLLFSRIESGARLVLVGDVDQLPSVGPGNVFKELIESGLFQWRLRRRRQIKLRKSIRKNWRPMAATRMRCRCCPRCVSTHKQVSLR